MPAPHPAKTILHALQNEHTTMDGGWYTSLQIARAQGMTPEVVGDALLELNRAGMIEVRYSPALKCEEVRSRGVQPDLRNIMASPGADAPAHEDDAVEEEHTARRLLNFLMTTGRGEWYADADLMQALDDSLTLGGMWSGLNLLEAAGLIQRRPDGRAIRLHMDLRRFA